MPDSNAYRHQGLTARNVMTQFRKQVPDMVLRVLIGLADD